MHGDWIFAQSEKNFYIIDGKMVFTFKLSVWNGLERKEYWLVLIERVNWVKLVGKISC